uniref:ENTH domain-containing protein n=1 Tax=Physcomitrium patens TaxID=3218 RepID=A0A7I4BJP1_PHYPA
MASQQSIRKALGAIKDSTKVGLAKVNSTYKELDIAVVKATNHVECPPKEKHVRMIFLATSASRLRADVAYCIHALARRIAKTHNWTVALKSMMVIHRTLREGDPTFREELINYGRNRGHILNLSNFKDDSSPHAWDYSAWVRTYALFLEERLECFRVLKYDVESERPTGHSRTRELDTVELLEHLPALQQLLFRLMGCQPEGAAISNYVIQAALGLVLKESFKLYRAINDGIINLVDKFFEMQRHDAVKALEIYKRAGQQAERLSDFYEVCKGLDLARSFQFPTLEQPPQSFLTTMEDYVKEAPRAGATLMLKNEPEYGERSPPRALEEPAPPSYKEEDYEEEPKASVPVPEKEPEPAPEPAVVEPMGNLLDLDSDLPNASALEEANALALAIIPDVFTNCASWAFDAPLRDFRWSYDLLLAFAA